MEEIKEGTSTLPLTKEMAKDFANTLINKLIDTQDEGEWGSLTMNLTYGPKEAPVVSILFFPGTTKENAIGVQQKFGEAGLSLNQVEG